MQLLATDFDGTLYLNNQIAPATLKAIKVWQNQGHQFGIVTGRDALMIHEKIKEYDLSLDFLIANNGAVINGKKGATISPAQLVALQVLQLEKESAHVFLFTEKTHYVQVLQPHSRYLKRHYDALVSVSGSELSQVTEVIQLSYDFATRKQAQHCVAKINNQPNLGLHALQNGHCVDVLASGIDKATGLGEYVASQGISRDKVIVIGDGENDLGIIQTYGGYSLPHATAKVRSYATGIVHSVGELIQLKLG